MISQKRTSRSTKITLRYALSVFIFVKIATGVICALMVTHMLHQTMTRNQKKSQGAMRFFWIDDFLPFLFLGMVINIPIILQEVNI